MIFLSFAFASAALRHRGRMGEPSGDGGDLGAAEALRAHACQHQPVILVIEAQLAVLSSSKRLLADAGPPAVLATAPDAAMLADVGATAVLAPAPLAVMVADSVLVPPQSLHWLLWRLCWMRLAPPQSMHLLLMRRVMLGSAPAEPSLVPLEVVLDFLAPPPRLRCAHPLSLPPPFRAGGRGRR